MKIAVISLIKNSAEGGGPVGLMPLFSRTIVDAQIDIARSWGASRIILLSEAMHGAILSLVDEISSSGIEAEISRSARDLLVEAAADDQVLYLGDGILPGIEVLGRIEAAKDELIFVAGTDDRFADYERIDINNRWLGVGVFSAQRLAGLSDIPEDWDTGSALLRTAVQDGARRDLLPDRMIAEGAVIRLESDDSISGFEKAALRTRTGSGLSYSGRASGGNFLDRIIRRPLQRLVVPRLWRFANPAPYLVVAPLLSGIGAAVCAWFNQDIAACALLAVTMLLMSLRSGYALFENVTDMASEKPHDILRYVVDFIAVATVLMLIYRQSVMAALVPNILLLIGALAACYALRKLPAVHWASWVKPDRLFMIVSVLSFAIFGQFIIGLYAVAIFNALFLVLGSRYSDLENTPARGS